MSARGWSVIGRSMVQFRSVEIAEIPKADWYFFYSPRGVQHLFAQHDVKGKFATIGARTAAALDPFEKSAHFIGTGHPGSTAASFQQILRADETVCFVQALRSRRSVMQLLSPEISTTELIVYQNELDGKRLPEADYLVFTSPLNVDGFLQHNVITPRQRVFSIGPTTTAHLEQRGIRVHATASQPDEIALAKMVLEAT